MQKTQSFLMPAQKVERKLDTLITPKAWLYRCASRIEDYAIVAC